MMPWTNYSKNVWSVISLSLLLFSISFLANSDETTSNAYETTNSTTASTESDVNTYDVNSSDVNILDVNNSNITISETLTMNSLPSSADVESTRKSFWYTSPQALLWKIWSGSTGFILCFCIFSLGFFLKTICVLKLMSTVFGKRQPKLIYVLISRNFFHLHIIFLTQAGLANL